MAKKRSGKAAIVNTVKHYHPNGIPQHLQAWLESLDEDGKPRVRSEARDHSHDGPGVTALKTAATLIESGGGIPAARPQRPPKSEMMQALDASGTLARFTPITRSEYDENARKLQEAKDVATRGCSGSMVKLLEERLRAVETPPGTAAARAVAVQKLTEARR